MAVRRSGAAGQLARNVFWLGGGEVAARAVGFAISLYLARTLDATGYGAIGIAAALVYACELLVRAGTEPAGVRAVARDPGSLAGAYARIAGLRLVLAGLVATAVWLALDPLSAAFDVPRPLLGLFVLAVFPVALAGFWALRGLEAMDRVAAARLLERLLVLGGVVLLVRDPGRDLLRVPLVEVAAAAAAVGGCYLLLSRREGGPLPLRFGPRSWPALLGEGAPVTLSLLLRSAYVQGDLLLLGWLAGAGSAGQFLVSQKLVLALALVVLVLRDASFPVASRLIRSDPAAALRLQARLYRAALLVLAPAVTVGWLFAAPLIEVLFGSDYPEAHRVLRIMLFTLPFVALSANLRNLLLAAAQPHPLPRADAIAVFVHVVLGVTLIPFWGAPGAAAACLAGECVCAVLLSRIARERFGALPLERRAFAPVVAAALMGTVLAVDWAGVPVRLLAGSLVYAAACIALGAIGRDELRELSAQLRDVTRSWSR